MSADLTLWLSDQIGHQVGEGDLSKMDALAVTAKIKAYAGVTCILIAGAHERKAHKALGYSSWEEYVNTEFDISKSRSYQLISQARFVLELSEAASTIVDVSEWEARELAPVAEEAKAAAKAAAESAPDPDDTEDVERRVREALAGVRHQQHENHKQSMGGAPDREAGERVGDNGADQEPPDEVATPPAPAEGGGESGAGEEVSAESATPPPSDPPTQGGTEGYRAAASRARSTVRSHLLTLDPERVIETTASADEWRDFSDDLHDWLGRLDSQLRRPGLKVVSS